jgi:hypothetical protein
LHSGGTEDVGGTSVAGGVATHKNKFEVTL